jgi:hypothetical protein
VKKISGKCGFRESIFALGIPKAKNGKILENKIKNEKKLYLVIKK